MLLFYHNWLGALASPVKDIKPGDGPGRLVPIMGEVLGYPDSRSGRRRPAFPVSGLSHSLARPWQGDAI
ncbi:hypothetical protein F4779DRAFT_618587 [Xylariaceae sp. FL0662B]|nr:hypothetical protein F4779DRAFT_618587 [Xylariaceae sp. FL0662B]